MNTAILLQPIGFVRGGRSEAVDDHWGTVETLIELDTTQFQAEATACLEDFSHIEVVFHFHQVPDEEINTGARYPRGCKDWPLVGIFAQRGKGRINRIGVTVCELLSINGLCLKVRGLDAINGTPVLDIKPVMTGFLPRGKVCEPAWAKELMAGYW